MACIHYDKLVELLKKYPDHLHAFGREFTEHTMLSIEFHGGLIKTARTETFDTEDGREITFDFSADGRVTSIEIFPKPGQIPITS